jgi:integrating conjugative element protein (TIGR03749 family)
MRLLSAEPGIVRQPIRQVAVELVPGKRVQATPLAAWRAGSLYVTAVKLTNRRKKAQVLDPRALRGHWLSATFQHARLLPAGDDADTTALYLVSARPFEESL